MFIREKGKIVFHLFKRLLLRSRRLFSFMISFYLQSRKKGQLERDNKFEN